jgi:hypothetical protein
MLQRRSFAKVYRMNERAEQQMKDGMDAAGVPYFSTILEQQGVTISRKPTTILQLNIGLYCNQACTHCHVESSPLRKEMMDFDVAEQCMRIIDNSPEIDTLDLTGGAPELNKAFRWLVQEGRKRNLRIIDRCNLTVLLQSGQEDLGAFLKEHSVNVVASLPCYSEANVRKQRGIGIFGKSILALQHLNSLGYGTDPLLQLDLVYNPASPSLPPAQPQLQADYKLRLMEDYGIEFNSLYTITNMPIKRSVYLYLYIYANISIPIPKDTLLPTPLCQLISTFSMHTLLHYYTITLLHYYTIRYADQLLSSGQLQPYMELLVNNFNPTAAEGVMCRDTLSVMYDGSIYDCDFNQQLGLGLGMGSAGSGGSEGAEGAEGSGGSAGAERSGGSAGAGGSEGAEGAEGSGGSGATRRRLSVFDLCSTQDLMEQHPEIVFRRHCFGCTAGAGSSCQGATT